MLYRDPALEWEGETFKEDGEKHLDQSVAIRSCGADGRDHERVLVASLWWGRVLPYLPPMPPNPRANQIKFVVLSADEARGEKPEGTLSALRKASLVYVKKLWLTEDQRTRIDKLYKSDNPGFSITSQEYDPSSSEQQVAAVAFLASQGLDIDA